jgi:acyl-coenzyme A thioesterase PaaI-like protein
MECLSRHDDFVRNFLFGNAVIHQDDGGLRTSFCMDMRMEGWVGIPHGGVGMAAITELAMMLGNSPQDTASLYPLALDFRMGGASVRVGDMLDVKISPDSGGAKGVITVGQNVLPYISASVSYCKSDNSRGELLKGYIPESYFDISNALLQLPYYKNCFVCGDSRIYPGLRRRFYYLDDGHLKKVIVSHAGFHDWDHQTFYLFQRNNVMHPIALLALIDETMGWAGFMASACAGVTVRIGYKFYRDVHVDEPIVVFGRGEKVRGNVHTRLLYWSSGGAAVIGNGGKLEIIAEASGQWFGVPELTEQMKVELMTKELTERAFRLAAISSSAFKPSN